MEQEIKEAMLSGTIPNQINLPEISTRYSDVELSEEEKQLCLMYGRKWKSAAIARREYADKVKAERSFQTLNSEGIRKYVIEKWEKATKQKFVIDESNEKIFKLLCLYFSNDTQFEKGDAGIYRLGKGIFLYGGLGVGKTTLMKMFYRNCNRSYAVVSCRSLADQYQNGGFYGADGFEGISKYSVVLSAAIGSNVFGHREIGYCFDDLGTEVAPAKHYGQEKNTMTETLLNRYDNGIAFNLTHMTTNLTFTQIKDSYGSRFLDRVKEMFNIIEFPLTAKSRR